MGYATFRTGDRGIVSKRSYKVLLRAQVVPSVSVNGVPTSWKRVVSIGSVTETVREFVGLSESDANSTGDVTSADGSKVSLKDSLVLSSGSDPVATYTREINRVKDGDSTMWTVSVHERSMAITEGVG